MKEMKNKNNSSIWPTVLGALIGVILGLTSGHLDNIYALVVFILTLAIGMFLLITRYIKKRKYNPRGR